jgi:hypothetical protein
MIQLRKLLKLLTGLTLILALLIGVASINHPIILKWLTGSARLIGKPIKAIIYTNGKANNEIEAYKVETYWNGEKANYYLLHFVYADTKETSEVISLNLKDNYAGKPSSTNKKDYDIILGLLFQSEVGAKFSKFTDDIKGYGFDPKLTFTQKQINLNIPTSAIKFKCDSIRVDFL